MVSAGMRQNRVYSQSIDNYQLSIESTMLIVNPLYDHAFKYLMQNERIARKVLSVILDQEVTTVELGSQETIVPDEKRQFTLYRLDFKATITSPDGRQQQVLIEMQKSKYDTDIQRFRNYLGSNYISRKTTDADGKPSYEPSLPIITIYILGYKLDELDRLAVDAVPRLTDSVTKEPLEVDSPFVNHLTHRSHIIQVRRLPTERSSRLERLLVFFNQAWVTSDKAYIIDLHDIPEEFADIATHLQAPVMDADFRRRLEVEEELDNAFDQQERRFAKQIEDAKQREEEALQREEEAKKREEEERWQKEEERRQKEEAKHREEEAKQTLATAIRNLSAIYPVAHVATMLGKSEEEVRSILGL